MAQSNLDLDELTDYLGREIDDNSALVLLSLQHSYQNVYSYWTARGIFSDLLKIKVGGSRKIILLEKMTTEF